MKTNLVIKDTKPAYTQISEYIRKQVATGQLKPLDRLPAIRTLAHSQHVDPGTAARAYLELENEGVIIAKQGSGTFVAPVDSGTAGSERRRIRISQILEKAIIDALGLGASLEDIETVATLRLADWRDRLGNSDKKRSGTPQTEHTIRFSGSHDLAIELLTRQLGTQRPRIVLKTNFVGSLSGLIALERGEADIAGAHLFDEATGEFNTPFVRKFMANESVALINLAQRMQGLMIAPGNPKSIIGIRDLSRSDITFVNRQKGSGTRIFLDSQLRANRISPAAIKGYEREETTHLAVASSIARHQADTGIGIQSAANVTGLDFIPLFKERYDLIILNDILNKPPFEVISKILINDTFQAMLNAIPGYDIRDTGKINIVAP